jgi:hypothetical protein
MSSEPNAGQFGFQADDAVIASTRGNHLNVLAILAYSTDWSTSAPADPPDNLTHYPPGEKERQYKQCSFGSRLSFGIAYSINPCFHAGIGVRQNPSGCRRKVYYHASLVASAY